MKMAVVTWMDAAFYRDEDYDLDFEFDLIETKTAGFLVSNNVDCVIIAQDFDGERIAAVTVIPKGMIKSIKTMGAK